MSSDPFDSVTPIGQRPEQRAASLPGEPIESFADQHDNQPPAIRMLGEHERRRREQATRGERAGRGEVRHDGKETPRRSSRSKKPLTARQLVRMTSNLARSLYRDAIGGTKATDRKHLSVGYAVMVDKLNALSGRPTEIIGVRDDLRPATVDLATKLAALGKRAAS